MVVSLAADVWIGYLMATVRIIAWLVVVPPFSARSFPTPVKVLLALGLAMASTPALEGSTISTSVVALVGNLLTQVAIGASMGLVTLVLLAAISAAGGLIDVFGGFSLAQGFDPLGMQGNTVFGTFHQLLATTLLFVSGLHLVIIGGLLASFRALPIGTSPDFGGATDVLVGAFQMSFVVAVQIALPVVAVLFMADLGLALLTKVAPQLNAINVMFPAKIGLTLLVLGFSFTVLPLGLDRLVEHVLDAMAAIVGEG